MARLEKSAKDKGLYANGAAVLESKQAVSILPPEAAMYSVGFPVKFEN